MMKSIPPFKRYGPWPNRHVVWKQLQVGDGKSFDLTEMSLLRKFTPRKDGLYWPIQLPTILGHSQQSQVTKNDTKMCQMVLIDPDVNPEAIHLFSCLKTVAQKFRGVMVSYKYTQLLSPQLWY